MVSSINKTVHHDITELLLKVALNTIALTLTFHCLNKYTVIMNCKWHCHIQHILESINVTKI